MLAKEGLQRPLQSVTSAVVTATACGSPCVSTAMWRLMPVAQADHVIDARAKEIVGGGAGQLGADKSMSAV